MSRTLQVGLVVATIVGLTRMVGVAQRTPANPLIGVWRVAERDTSGPNATKNTNPQPGLWIFTAQYFSENQVTSATPRTDLPSSPTDKERADAWAPFAAQAGTYEIQGDTIVLRRTANKNPAGMTSGNFLTHTFRKEGNDVLWLTQKANEGGPIANPLTQKIIRVE